MTKIEAFGNCSLTVVEVVLQVEVGKMATVSVLHVQEEALLALDSQTSIKFHTLDEQRILEKVGFILTLRGYSLRDWFP